MSQEVLVVGFHNCGRVLRVSFYCRKRRFSSAALQLVYFSSKDLRPINSHKLPISSARSIARVVLFGSVFFYVGTNECFLACPLQVCCFRVPSLGGDICFLALGTNYLPLEIYIVITSFMLTTTIFTGKRSVRHIAGLPRTFNNSGTLGIYVSKKST